MNTSKLFAVKRDGATLIVALPKTAVTFADEQIQAEVQDILERLMEPSISNVVLDFDECPYFGSAILVRGANFSTVETFYLMDSLSPICESSYPCVCLKLFPKHP